MNGTPLPDTAGPGTQVFAIFEDDEGTFTWVPAVILERLVTIGPDEITVMWLDGDRASNHMTAEDVRMRDQSVAYHNFVLNGFEQYPTSASAVDPTAAGGGSAARGGSAASGSKRSGESSSKTSEKKAKTETKPNDAKLQARIDFLQMQRGWSVQRRDELIQNVGTLQGRVNDAYAERDTAITVITERDTAITERDNAITERDAANTERDTATTSAMRPYRG